MPQQKKSIQLPSETFKSIVDKINVRIEEKGISVMQLSRDSGINHVSIYELRNGTIKGMNLFTFFALCDALELKITLEAG